MAKEKIYIQDYEINGCVLKVTSGSGKVYELSQKSCTCKGFSFRRTCGHIEEAEQRGLLKLLMEKEKKRVRVTSQNDTRTKLRKDALRKFLEKNGVTFNEDTVDRIEKVLSEETTPDQVIHMAGKMGEQNETK